MSNAEKILYLLKRSPMTRLELESKAGLTDNGVYHAIKRLRQKGVKVYPIQTTKTKIVYEIAT